MIDIRVKITALLAWVRLNIGLPEIFFLVGMASLYSGLSALLSASLAQTVCGAVLVFLSVLMAWKTA
jgi:hypothetical protein